MVTNESRMVSFDSTYALEDMVRDRSFNVLYSKCKSFYIYI